MITAGYALSGSFCTFEKSMKEMRKLKDKGFNIVPIMSFNSSATDTRFGKADEIKKRIEEICDNNIIESLVDAEPVGPKKICDVMVVSPCSATTIAKIANSIYDTPVTLAVKSHLRNERPVVIGISTNDALRNSAGNIGRLFNMRNFYFIPMKQDDYINKPYSIVCDFEKTAETVESALLGKQIQPMLL